MNKSDLINALADKEGLQNKEAFDIVNMIFAGFTNTMKEGGRIEIRGLGSFFCIWYRFGATWVCAWGAWQSTCI